MTHAGERSACVRTARRWDGHAAKAAISAIRGVGQDGEEEEGKQLG